MEQRIVEAKTVLSEKEPAFELADHEILHLGESTLVEPPATGWMHRSSLRKHFHVTYSSGVKLATCVHCGKGFKERKSTGNLSKHIKNIHPHLFIPGRDRSRNVDSSNCRSLAIQKPRLPSFIVAASTERPEEFFEIDLLIEKQLPLSITSTKAWKRFTKNTIGTLAKPRSSISLEKISMYLQSFDNELIDRMQSTDYINLVPCVHRAKTGEAFLTVTASFIPGLLKNKFPFYPVGDTRNSRGSSSTVKETHLLDFISLDAIEKGHASLDSEFTNILGRFDISRKVLLLTNDLAWQTLAERFPVNIGHKLGGEVNDLGSIRCASEMLETLLALITSELVKNGKMKKAFERLGKLGELINESETVKESLVNRGIFPVPTGSNMTAMCIWQQAFVYLTYHDQFINWTKSAKFIEAAEEFREIEECSQTIDESYQCLEYFVACCSIFQHLDKLIQKDDFNRLSNAATLYFTLKHYYDACHSAVFGKIVQTPGESFDFSFINGNKELPDTIKLEVLNAVHQSLSEFANYFQLFKNNDMYFVAVMLNPTMRIDSFRNFMTSLDAEHYYERTKVIIEQYMKYQESVGVHPDKTSVVRTVTICGEIPKVPNFNFELSVQSNRDLPDRGSSRKEWDLYLHEVEATQGQDFDALNWWHSRQEKFRGLFPLAVSLLTTKFSISSSPVPAVVEKMLAGKGLGAASDNHARLQVLLQDRFQKFGLHRSESDDGFETSRLVSSGSTTEDDDVSNDFGNEVF
ncbi:putative transposase of the Rover3 hAT-like family [Lachancea meyersii CBS 8951]|uniref:Putative transposase of the Rover3 hAT-like family n=1 Tax=Lachancea meyersii CBS 8951 TaxID=1266667 RepID=A0A1G4IYS0_9SACH|nr:putative transposase of the Rover3 hAT-like family [Lachancea meyersii CBS 8951]